MKRIPNAKKKLLSSSKPNCLVYFIRFFVFRLRTPDSNPTRINIQTQPCFRLFCIFRMWYCFSLFNWNLRFLFPWANRPSHFNRFGGPFSIGTQKTWYESSCGFPFMDVLYFHPLAIVELLNNPQNDWNETFYSITNYPHR